MINTAWSYVLLAFLSCAAAVSPAPAAEGCLTAQCHATLLKHAVVHPVAESCESCHRAVATPHPRKNTRTFGLVEDPPRLCRQCHAPQVTMKHVHPPVRDGMCLTCHNPHASKTPKLLTQPAATLCSMCHPRILQEKHQHGPAATGDCATCHAPHDSNTARLLLAEGEQLCFGCHVDLQQEMQKKVVHTAVRQGCTSCHNPHSAPVRKLLTAEGQGLCVQCHPRIGERIEKAQVVHKPLQSDRGCASCHAPHAGDGPNLLPKTGKDLCTDCHRSVILKDQTVLHGPIAQGTCTPCHDPHGSPHAALLMHAYRSDFYLPYTEREYALCFSCHNRDLLRHATTSFATGFRDGEKNLHYVHVNRKDKGRACKSCHQTHASAAPKLIADRVPFGKWSLPIQYEKSETGGSCAPGCHQKYSYDRKTPGKAPDTRPVSPKDKEKRGTTS